jgi:hypothetical protein
MDRIFGKEHLDSTVVFAVSNFPKRPALKNSLNGDVLLFREAGKVLENLNLIARPKPLIAAAGQLRGVDDVEFVGPTAACEKCFDFVKNPHKYSSAL